MKIQDLTNLFYLFNENQKHIKIFPFELKNNKF